MDDKMDAKQKLQGDLLEDPLDAELRAIWQPAPAAEPRLRANLLAAIEREPESVSAIVRPAAIELAARRPEGSSRRLAGPQMRAPRRGMSRPLVAALGAVALLAFARIAVKEMHGHPARALALSEPGPKSPAGATAAVDPNELTAEDEQFALGGADDDDSDDAPSVLELAADDDQGE